MTVGEQYSFYRVPKVLFTAECFKFLSCEAEGTEKHTIFILTLIKKKKSIRVFMILVDFLLDKI